MWMLNDQIAARGLHTCPTNCTCDQLTACGEPYLPPQPPVAGATLAAATCTSPVEPAQAWSWDVSGDGALHVASNASLCVSLPSGGGVGTYPLAVAQCGGAATLTWSRDASTGHFATTVGGESGVCLDLRTSDGAIGLYQCGSGGGLDQRNQGWAVDTMTGVVASMYGASGASSGGATCVTAVNPAASALAA